MIGSVYKRWGIYKRESNRDGIRQREYVREGVFRYRVQSTHLNDSRNAFLDILVLELPNPKEFPPKPDNRRFEDIIEGFREALDDCMSFCPGI